MENVKVIEKDTDILFSDVVNKSDWRVYESLIDRFNMIGDEDSFMRTKFYAGLVSMTPRTDLQLKENKKYLDFKENPLRRDENDALISIEKPVVVQQVLCLSTPSITKKYLTKNKYSRPGTKRSKTTKIAWHYVGGAKVPAINTWRYFQSLKEGVKLNGRYLYASSQYIVGLKGEIYQLMPDNEIAYTTNQANSYSIGVECSHINADGKYTEAEYRSMVWLGATLAKKYALNPKKDFIRHYDVTGKLCPLWFVKHPDDWTQFKQDCYDVLHGKDLDLVVGNYQPIKNRYDYNFKTTCEVVGVKKSLNVRDSRPVDGELGELLFTIPLGEKVKISYVLNDWAYIDYKGRNGFVNIKYLKIVS